MNADGFVIVGHAGLRPSQLRSDELYINGQFWVEFQFTSTWGREKDGIALSRDRRRRRCSRGGDELMNQHEKLDRARQKVYGR